MQISGCFFFFFLLIRWSKGLRGSRDFGSMHKVNSAVSNGIVRFHSSALIRISAKWSHSTECPLNWNQGRLCLLSQISAPKMRMIWKCWTHYILLVVSQKCSSKGYGFLMEVKRSGTLWVLCGISVGAKEVIVSPKRFYNLKLLSLINCPPVLEWCFHFLFRRQRFNHWEVQ